jgi:TRAP-type mannitol/chloroaromatic compound transport system permease large subunit
MRQRLQSIERLGIDSIPGSLHVAFLVVCRILSAATGIAPVSFSAVALQAS